MTTTEIQLMKTGIFRILRRNAHISLRRINNLLPRKSLQGKLYEVHVLATILDELTIQEGCGVKLIGSSHLVLKQKGSPINRSYPYFEIWKDSKLFGEIFNDVYFSTLSYQLKGYIIPKTFGDYHELDIVMVKPYNRKIDIEYPRIDDIMIAVECKCISQLTKNIIREVLGYRRELSTFVSTPEKTPFNVFPIDFINSKPNSVHMFYCTDERVTEYHSNCIQFGTIVKYHRP